MKLNIGHLSKSMKQYSNYQLEKIVSDVFNYENEERLAAAWELDKRGKPSIDGKALERNLMAGEYGESIRDMKEKIMAGTHSGNRNTATIDEQDEENLLLPYPTVDVLVLASGGKRFLNFLIDKVAVVVFIMFLFVSLDLFSEVFGSGGFLGEDASGVQVIGFVGYFAYYLFSEAVLNGRTVGKLFTRTRVLDEEGKKPAFHKLLGRALARVIPFEAFSFLGEDARGWHDTLSGTIVIDEDKSVLRSEWV